MDVRGTGPAGPGRLDESRPGPRARRPPGRTAAGGSAAGELAIVLRPSLRVLSAGPGPPPPAERGRRPPGRAQAASAAVSGPAAAAHWHWQAAAPRPPAARPPASAARVNFEPLSPPPPAAASRRPAFNGWPGRSLAASLELP